MDIRCYRRIFQVDLRERNNMNNLFNLNGKVVVVTGGTRGIGASIAKGCKEAGARVWIHGSDEETTKKIATLYGYEYGWGDLSQMEGIDNLIERILEKEEKIDVIFNNAGYETHKSVEDSSEEFLDKTYQINTKSPYFLVQRLLPLLKKSKGASIINVTSIHDVVPVRENASYCMSKASMAMYTKVAALELAKYKIRVNNLAPGAIRTDHNESIVKEMDFDSWIPLGRVGDADEMIGPAIFLASEASSYMTGSTIYVDGGYKENLLRY